MLQRAYVLLSFVLAIAVIQPALGAQPSDRCDVILHQDQFVLRDFYESGMESPHIGDEVSTEIENLRNSSLSEIGISIDLVARKLADLERVHPELSKYLVAAIQSHFWKLTDLRPPPSTDDSRTVDFKAGECQGLTSYLGNTILFYRPTWVHLSEIQKVAAILHQVFFSFVKTTSRGNCLHQSEGTVKELIANIFRPSFDNVNIRNELSSYFSLPLDLSVDLCTPSPLLPYEMELISAVDVIYLDIAPLNTKYLKDTRQVPHLYSVVKNFCQQSLRNKNTFQQLTIGIRASRTPFNLEKTFYDSSYGPRMSLAIQRRAPHLFVEQSWNYRDASSCAGSLTKLVKAWQHGTLVAKRIYACTEGF